MTYAELDKIARKVVRKLARRLPSDVGPDDAYQDACAEILRWAPVDPPVGVDREAFLVMKGWGTLKDKYARLFDKQRQRQEAERQSWARLPPQAGEERDADNLVPTNPGRQYVPAHEESADIQVDVQSAIDRLSPVWAKMIRMEMAGHDHETIAESVGYSRSWVSRQITLAKERLCELLESYS